MSDKLSEKEVLKKLNIKNFRQLSKDHVIEMASLLDEMSPEVAKKALSQFPNFAQMTQKSVDEFQQRVDRIVESNDKALMTAMESIQETINILQEQLKDPDLTFEQKMIIMSWVDKCHDRLDSLEARNKNWLAGVVTVAGSVALGGAAVGAFILTGGRVKINPATILGKK